MGKADKPQARTPEEIAGDWEISAPAPEPARPAPAPAAPSADIPDDAGLSAPPGPNLAGTSSAGPAVIGAGAASTDSNRVGNDSSNATKTGGGSSSPGSPRRKGDKNRKDARLGTKLGKYQITGILGRGGMGVVYEAEDPLIQRKVAIKLLPESLSNDAGARERFLLEAQSAGKLFHPNAVAVFDVDCRDGSYYIAMELVRGGSAADFLAKYQAFNWPEATRVIADACRGLHAAHEVGLIHRDIKPANIMRSDKGVVKLADFGLAKPVGAAAGTTQAGSLIGTPHYMSPEQCQTEDVDARADIYSLGATYYCLLTGGPPYQRGSVQQIMYSHAYDPIPDPRAANPVIPDGCAEVVMRAMAKSPDERYQTAADMLRDLEALLAGKPEMDNVQEWNQMVAAAETLAKPGRAGAPPRPASGMMKPASGMMRPGSGAIRPASGMMQPEPASVAPGRPIVARKSSPPVGLIVGGAAALLLIIIGAVFVFRGKGAPPPNTTADAKNKKDETPPDRIVDPPDRTPDPTPDPKPDPKPDPVAVSVGDALQKELDDLSTTARIARDKKDAKALAASMKSLTAFRDTHRAAADQKRRVLAESADVMLRDLQDVVAKLPDARFPDVPTKFPGGLALTKTLTGHGAAVNAVTFSPDGRTIGSAGQDGDARLWAADTGSARELPQRHQAGVGGLAFNRDGTKLAVAGKDRRLGLWDSAGGRLLGGMINPQRPFGPSAFSPTENTLVVGLTTVVFGFNADGAAPRALSQLGFAAEHESEVMSLAFSPDGKLLATAAYDGSLWFWNAKDFRTVTPGRLVALAEAKRWAGHVGIAASVAFSPDGKTLATGGTDGVKLWEVPSGNPVRGFGKESVAGVSAVVWLDGKRIAAGGTDGVLTIWDAEAGKEISKAGAHKGGVSGIAVSGDRICTGGADGTVKLWTPPPAGTP